MNKQPAFKRITPHIYKLSLWWWGFEVGVWLVSHEGQWVLIDAGPPGFADTIVEAVEDAIANPPQTIIITHGHIDHVGSLAEITRRWHPQLWVHALEVPYLTGAAQYADIPSSNWGYSALARRVPLHSTGFEISRVLNDGDECHGLRVVHVPGHAPGMIALLHGEDRALIAADAFRFKPFSAMPIFTYDRELARRSMRKLAALDFDHLLVSHGRSYLGDGKQRAVKAAE